MPTDEELMVRFQAGDADSFADLAGRYSASLVTLAGRYLKAREDAEEVRQETLLRVYSKAGTFRSGASFRPWIYRIAVNLCRDRARRRRRVHWVSLSDDSNETRSLPEENAPQGDEFRAGEEAIFAQAFEPGFRFMDAVQRRDVAHTENGASLSRLAKSDLGRAPGGFEEAGRIQFEACASLGRPGMASQPRHQFHPLELLEGTFGYLERHGGSLEPSREW